MEIQGTPQDQISLPGAASNAPHTAQLPIQAVDTDQLPREGGLSYDEVTSIIGSLYLDSHHAMKVREEQFQAILNEHEAVGMRLQAELQGKQEEVNRLVSEVTALRRELEIRKDEGRQSRLTTPSSPDRPRHVSGE